MFQFIRSKINPLRRATVRNFGAGHGGGHGHGHGVTSHGIELHEPQGAKVLGQAMLYIMYFWVFYQFKQNGAQLFGFYEPWKHPHEHHHGLKYKQENVGVTPELADDEDEEEEHEEHDGHGHHH